MTRIVIDRTPAEIEAIREELSRILNSNLFTRSHRQGRFLNYIVEEALAGRAGRLNQYLLGIEVFEREDSFDPTVDSIVRVEAGRLRSKLREYYADVGPDDPLVIELPKGSYEVQFRSGSGKSSVQNTTSETDKRSIAVLPFDNMSNDPEQEYFADGITEDLITDLSKLSGLFVISRHSTFVYKGKSINIKQVSKDLGVRYVLEGSVRKSGERIRIVAQLIDANTDKHLWAERYDRKLDDIFEVQDEVARKIVSALEVNLTELEDERLGHKGTENIAAHDSCLRGQEQFYLSTPDGINNAIEAFSRSIELDPNYAEAYAWKSRTIIFLFVAGFTVVKEDTVIPALALARKAVELDDLLPRAHIALGWALLYNQGIDEAIIEANKAVNLDPNFADGFLQQSMILSSSGDGQNALEAIKRGIRFNPQYSVIYILAHGISYFTMGEYEMAIPYFDRAIERNPNFLPGYIFKMSTLAILERVEGANSTWAGLLEVNPGFVISNINNFYNDEHLQKLLLDGMIIARDGVSDSS